MRRPGAMVLERLPTKMHPAVPIQGFQSRRRAALMVDLRLVVVLDEDDVLTRGALDQGRRRASDMVTVVGNWWLGVTWT